jgi:hypothetical protein
MTQASATLIQRFVGIAARRGMARLLAIFAVFVLALSPIAAAAQGAGCHCPDPGARAAMVASHPERTVAPTMPCCTHGKACDMACGLNTLVAAPVPSPTTILQIVFQRVLVQSSIDRILGSAALSPEFQPPRRSA